MHWWCAKGRVQCSEVLLQQINWACYIPHLYSTAYDAYSAFELFTIDYDCKLQFTKNGIFH